MSDDEYESIEETPPVPPLKRHIHTFREFTPEELTEDGIPTLEAQIRAIELDIEEKRKEPRPEKDLTMRVKCLSLTRIGYDIFTNTNNLPYYDRERLQETMHSYEDRTPEEIIEEFNEVCERKVFNVVDYSRYPMYNV
jgi:hypothetical protein